MGRKSFSIERTFGDISKESELLAKLKSLCDSLAEHARKKKLVGKTLTLKLKTNKFDILNEEANLLFVALVLMGKSCMSFSSRCSGLRFRLRFV